MERKVAVVTGGAGGIGAAVSRAFVSEGTSVTIADMDRDASAKLAKELNADNEGSALGLQVEVTDEHSVNSVVQSTIEAFGRIDFLVHCAGNNGRQSNARQDGQCLALLALFETVTDLYSDLMGGMGESQNIRRCLCFEYAGIFCYYG